MELKPCPFCGGEADVYWRKGRKGTFVYCKCSICDAQTGTKTAYGDPDIDADFWKQNSVQAVEHKWNTRVKGNE